MEHRTGNVLMPHDVMKRPIPCAPRVRARIALHGAVQGVGFRPFVHRLATEMALTGWVNNSPQGVLMEVESQRGNLEQFLKRLRTEKPPHSQIQAMETAWLDATGFDSFEIRSSERGGEQSVLVLPDIATCPDCLREIFDPRNRRYRYPFTNCTHCGPRFSIIEALPYDRANTTMRQFVMCPACQTEYDNPQDRRFHAQPNACPVCGPRLELRGAGGEAVSGGDQALRAAAKALKQGKIVAAKGIGGFHLLADARSEKIVRLLRQRKHREEKPLALLFPNLDGARKACRISPLEERLLVSPEAPIVLLRRVSGSHGVVAESVAPGNPNLGVMLPSNPIHHLLMAELGFPVVATSGNLSDEPLCTDEWEAIERLRGIADFFLVHDRPIIRHVDDSVMRVVLGREMMLRRARGFAPLPVTVSTEVKKPVLAVGAHLKNAVALATGRNVFISQHIGDLETVMAGRAFHRVIADFQELYHAKPAVVAADLHPDYLSTRFAQESGIPVLGVQHHIAHVLSCIAENDIPLPALGVAWDGAGYGTDGTIWGGEFFCATPDSVERVASLRPFHLPGSNAAIREPRRSALGMLFDLLGDVVFENTELAPVAAFTAAELAVLKTMCHRRLNSPKTSSVGRLFDAVAAMANLRQRMQFEGQAGMDLEFALAGVVSDESYQIPLAGCRALCVLDWGPMVKQILRDLQCHHSIGVISAKFHNALAEAITTIARRVGLERVALSGGCFQNRYLLERAVKRLRAEKFQPYWHQRVPANDGGIALGQVVAATRAETKLKSSIAHSTS